MFIYSKKIIHFANELKHIVKNILVKETHFKVSGNHFCDSWGFTSYPINIIIYNNKNTLGYFNSEFYELGFHETLMHVSKEQLYNIIRHELAHYFTFISYGETVLSHGIEFKMTCEKMRWGEGVSRASALLEEITTSTIEDSSVLRKVQKLMALSSSSNKNEAEAAMIKSQQLLLKHNIESNYLHDDHDEKIFLKRILKQKREDAKMSSIAHILETFFVSIVYNRINGFTYLEILGNEVNIEIADYIANVLNTELDVLWKQAQKQTSLKGLRAKNSFFTGVAKGYYDKIQALKKEYNSDTHHALMVIEKKLAVATAMVYPRLTSSTSQAGYCKESAMLGEQMGRELNLNPAINNASKKSEALITH